MLQSTRKFWCPIAATLYLLLCNTSAFAAFWQHELKSDEFVQLQNSTAKTDALGKTQVRVHAWVYERERRLGARRLFAAYLGIDLDALSAPERAAFSERTKLFLVDVQKNKKLTLIASDGSKIQLSKTDQYGAVNELVTLPMTDPNRRDAQNSLWENYSVQGPKVKFLGRALRVPNQGISIVSDIDDTIRNTHVLNRREMLMNTFVRPLKALPGMASLYQHAAAVPGVRIHYVSNAPYALYPLLQQFLRGAQFPEGSMHLRAVSFKSSIWRAVLHLKQVNTHKTEVIESLLSDFPERSLVLIGDTGEQDPEVYGAIARAHPERVRMILLHDITGDARTSPRFQREMRDVPAVKWLLYTDAKTLNLAVAKISSATQSASSTAYDSDKKYPVASNNENHMIIEGHYDQQ